MVLRKPYAFLIKHFKLIHIVLFVLLAYVTLKSYFIVDFFQDYITNKTTIEIFASNYTSPLVVLSSILIIIISIFIYFLMRYKNKPKRLYAMIIILILISSIATSYLINNIRVLETGILSAKKIRLLRDISRFNYWGLLILSIPILIRGLGFDIKKFDFNKDLMDLKLEEKDNEEVEVNVDLTSDGIKRSGHKAKRELKYYYAENKLIINIILGIIVIVLFLMFPFDKFVLNRTLSEGNTLSTNNFNFIVNNSYITKRKRTSENNSYIILKTSIKGKVNKYELDLNHFVLEGENNNYIPSLKYYYYFTDLGIGYKKEYLSTEESQEYLLIYNINDIDKDSKFKLHYIEDDRYIKLSPETIK